MFHVDRLRPTKTTTLVPNREPARPLPIIVEEEEEYEVEKILDSRIRRGKLEYFVKWKGFPTSENSWEPTENTTHASRKIAEFHRTHPGAPRRIEASLFSTLQFRPINEFFDPVPPETLQRVGDWENGRNGNFRAHAFQRKGL